SHGPPTPTPCIPPPSLRRRTTFKDLRRSVFSSGLYSSRLLPHHRRIAHFILRGSSPPRAHLFPSFSLEVLPKAIVDSSSSPSRARLVFFVEARVSVDVALQG
ncbi:hypothetical protein PIB30_093530, partial [Stylosanthes scabra]|nr:hypothetical protein [Stylosanthes scabra]